MNRVLALQEKFKNKPFGNYIFSKILARMAPYFKTIDPKVVELRHNYMKASLKKKPKVHNHIKTVHAIACCNLCEFAAGVCMEASIPKNRRWIPKSMEVDYLKKAGTDLTAVCDLSFVDWETVVIVPCPVSVYDTNGVEVVKATIKMYVTDRPKKK